MRRPSNHHSGELGNADNSIVNHGRGELAAPIGKPILENVFDIVVFVVTPRVEREGDDAIFVGGLNGTKRKRIREHGISRE
jgi:hypothetical protein